MDRLKNYIPCQRVKWDVYPRMEIIIHNNSDIYKLPYVDIIVLMDGEEETMIRNE